MTIQVSFQQAFGLAVRARRTKLGLSQDELANRTGLHRTYVGSVERGQRNVSLVNIVALAAGLGMSASKLMREAEGIQA